MKTPLNVLVLRFFAPTFGFGVVGLGCVLSRRLGAVRAFNLGFGLIDLYQALASVTDLWPRPLFLWTRVDDTLHVIVALVAGRRPAAD